MNGNIEQDQNSPGFLDQNGGYPFMQKLSNSLQWQF